MATAPQRDFPLFPLEMVALPSEVVPLHIFEERYKTMIDLCLDEEKEFGIVWLSDDGLKAIGCACEVVEVIERLEDGRLNIVTRGTRPVQIEERQEDLPFPAGLVTFPEDKDELPDAPTVATAQEVYADLVEQVTDRRPTDEELAEMTAYAMAATVDFGPDAKQGLLDLRSENARYRLLTRLLRAARRRLDAADKAQARARTNGKVRFS
jgi:Lon protease-like protein